MGTYVKEGNSCIGCQNLLTFPNDCLSCGNLKNSVEIIKTIGERLNIYDEMLENLEWFCKRVEKGEVRSRRTYSKYKELIKKAKDEKYKPNGY